MSPEITLIRFTGRQGEVEDAFPRIVKTIQENCKAVGGKLKEAYVVQGRYDAVILTEMPNPEASIQVWLPVLKSGWVHTETLTGIPYENFLQISRESRKLQAV